MDQKTIFPSLKGKLRHPFSSSRRVRILFLFRRVAAVGLFLTAAVITLHGPEATSAQPQQAATRLEPTVSLAHDLPAGTRLTNSDVRVAMMPANLRPAKAFSFPEQVLGEILIGPARSGEVLTDHRLSSTVTGLPPPGKPAAGNSTLSIVPVRLSDPGVAELLKPGAKVDVVSTDSARQESRVLASNISVVTVITAAATSAEHEAARINPLVLLAAPSESSASIAAATLEKPVTVTLR